MRRMAMMMGALALGAALATTAMTPVQARQGMTEADFDAVMKRTGPAFGGLRKALEANDAALAAKQAAVLTQAFTETGTFWKGRGKADAAGWAADARATVATIDGHAKSGNWEGATASAKTLQGFCASCHTAYRDKAEDGSYRIKPGS